MYTVPVSFPPIDIKIMAVNDYGDDDDDDDEPLQSIPFWQMGVLVRSGWGLAANKENWAHLVDAKHDINAVALEHWAYFETLGILSWCWAWYQYWQGSKTSLAKDLGSRLQETMIARHIQSIAFIWYLCYVNAKDCPWLWGISCNLNLFLSTTGFVLYWCFQVWLGDSPMHGHSSDEKLSSREHIVLLGISRGWVIGIGAMGGGQDVSRSHAILPREENSSTETIKTNAWSSYQSH